MYIRMTEEKKTEKKPQAQSKATSVAVDAFFAKEDFASWIPSLEKAFASGSHYGHKKSRRNPKMEEYIYTYRGDLALIDLNKTLVRLKEAMEYVSELASTKKTLLFVGTKKHAQRITRSVADRCESPFVAERWLGGTFTNFEAIRKRVRYLEELEGKIEAGEMQHYTKFEQMKKAEEVERLERKVGGLRLLKELPSAIIVADIKNDANAIAEAKKAGVPIVAIVDTNDDPSSIDYPIPANNDAISSLKYIFGNLCGAYLRGIEKQALAPSGQEKAEK